MRPIRRILVAVKDPGAKSLPAVAKAAWLARACGAHLEIFHSVKASVFANTLTTYEAALLDLHDTQRRHYLQRLGRIAARLRLHGVKVSTAVEYDYPAYEAIVRRACATKADLIVSGSHHDRHTAAGLLRLTDWELLRQSPMPVLLVKRSRPYRHPNVLAVATFHGSVATWSVTFLAAAIGEVARRTQAAIVVMGALSRSGLKRLIAGNTAEGLLDELPCDLLIVKPAQFASRVTGTCKGPRLVAKAG